MLKENLSKDQLKTALQKVGLNYANTKSHNQNINRLNTAIRSQHPLQGFLQALRNDELEYLYNYFSVMPKRLVILSAKIFGASRETPIQKLVTILSAKENSFSLK